MLNSSGESIPGPGTTGTADERETFHGGQLFGVPAGIDLVHLGARVLTCKDGQWAQPEPYLWLGVPTSKLNSPQSLHPFRYAGNNPIMMKDPSGFGSQPVTPNDVPIDPLEDFDDSPTTVFKNAGKMLWRDWHVRVGFQESPEHEFLEDVDETVQYIPKVNILRDIYVMFSGKNLAGDRVSPPKRRRRQQDLPYSNL
jgi:hypothetical protein